MRELENHSLVNWVETHASYLRKLLALRETFRPEELVEMIDDRAIDGILLLVSVRGEGSVKSHILLGELAIVPNGFSVYSDLGSGQST